MSAQKQGLIIYYQPNRKYELYKRLCGHYPSLEVIKAMSTYTEENLLGGYAPDY